MKSNVVCWYDHVRIQYFLFCLLQVFNILSSAINYIEEHKLYKSTLQLNTNSMILQQTILNYKKKTCKIYSLGSALRGHQGHRDLYICLCLFSFSRISPANCLPKKFTHRKHLVFEKILFILSRYSYIRKEFVCSFLETAWIWGV